MTKIYKSTRPMRVIIIISIILFFQACQSNMDKTAIKLSDTSLSVHWELLKNEPDEAGTPKYYAKFTLENLGTSPLKHNWVIYFNQTYGPYAGRTQSGNMIIEHINGDFYRLLPAEDFEPLASGESVEVNYIGQNWAIKKNDAPAGLYLVFKDEKGVESKPQALDNYHIAPFVTKAQLNRLPSDKFPIPTAAYRYEKNAKLSRLNADALIPIIPTPVKAQRGQGSVEINNSFAICYFDDLRTETDYISDELAGFGLKLKSYDGGACNRQAIKISLVTQAILGKKQAAYRLTIDAEKELILLEGTDKVGIFYAIQSLKSLVATEAYQQENEQLILPAIYIEDAPRFDYRGLHLDVARNFQNKKSVKKLLDIMATYKLNKFHFHLTDDEGWRLEISGLPELTEVGGRRGIL